MYLTDAKEGKVYKISSIEEGKRTKLKLISMGIFPEVFLEVIKNDKKTPILVGIKTLRISIGRGLASRIKLYEK